MPSRPRSDRSQPSAARLALTCAGCAVLLVTTACSGAGDETGSDQPSGTAGATAAPSTGAVSPAPEEPVDEQPPLPSDPAGYTTEYVQATLTALFGDHQAALAAFKASGEVDDTVRAALAGVYHPEVYDQQIRNLEDYFPGGENLEDPPGAVRLEVTDLHSVTADCILAITTYDIGAVTTLDAPAEDGFFIGLARNPDDPDGTRPWLITVEYGTSDGEPLSGDVCS